jgi:hypothetical protein
MALFLKTIFLKTFSDGKDLLQKCFIRSQSIFSKMFINRETKNLLENFNILRPMTLIIAAKYMAKSIPSSQHVTFQ